MRKLIFIFSSFYVILKSIVLTILLCVFFNNILELVLVSNTVTCVIQHYTIVPAMVSYNIVRNLLEIRFQSSPFIDSFASSGRKVSDNFVPTVSHADFAH